MKSLANTVPIVCLSFSFVLTVVLFMESRNDPSLRIAALVSATGLVNTYAAIASTMLTGKDLTQKQPVDAPPGSVVTDKTVVQTPPVDPNVKP